jgi:small GTP-binding protein
LRQRRVKLKICLVGDRAVGKTSLVRRYVLDQFDDRYATTLGTKVSKKVVHLDLPAFGQRVEAVMTLWDVAGSLTYAQMLHHAYFHNAQGVLAVCDLTARSTLEDIDAWIDTAYAHARAVPVQFVVNKGDLRDDAEFGEDDVRAAAGAYDAPWVVASARTGDHVEEAFRSLARAVVLERVERAAILQEVPFYR